MTEQEVKDAIEEFGEFAHERFIENYPVANEIVPVYFTNNEALLSMSDLRFLELKPLPELFEHDIEVYGADAYLMWDIDTQWILDFNFSFSDNFTVECALTDDRSLVSRKTSAALPFDLERAKAGDVVEYFERGEWHAKTSISNDFIIDERYLRMKYPKK